MPKARVMHFVNQFFAGKGAGEEKAGVPLGFSNEPLGPGKRLQALFGDSAEIVVTAYCGDNYFNEHRDEVLEKIKQAAKDQNVNLVVAGPAFLAGRYGFACVEICHSLSASLGLYGVTGMHIENPGVDTYKQYKDIRLVLFQTAEAVRGMEEALSKMARCILKLATGSPLGPPSEEGYIPRGIRIEEFVSKTGAERAIDMLLNKLAGHPVTTEIPVESLEAVPHSPPVTNLSDACIALVFEGGLVPQGNPDGFRSALNDVWAKYPIDKLDSMKDGKWDVFHGGYYSTFMIENPNYGVPLDVCRELEREGVFGQLYPYFYATTGFAGRISVMEGIGKAMVSDMKAKGIDAALLVST